MKTKISHMLSNGYEQEELYMDTHKPVHMYYNLYSHILSHSHILYYARLHVCIYFDLTNLHCFTKGLHSK